jgi:cytochrome c-type biogenesis protein CcsB
MQEIELVHLGIVLLLVSLLFQVLRTQWTAVTWIREAGWATMALSLVSFIASIVLRSQTAQYFALSNMYESMMFLIMWTQVAFLVLDRWFRLPSLGWPVCMLVLVGVVYTISLPTEILPLQAALQSYWRAIHVPVIILSYAMFTMAFLSSVIYLVKYLLEQRGGSQTSGGGPMLATAGMPEGFKSVESDLEADVGGILTHQDAHQSSLAELDASTLDASKDAANVYDEITYRCIAVGFPLLTIGIILGGLWANEAWGNYWSWDPKESMSLVTLLGYGVYLHMRVNRQHPPKTLAIVSIIGFVLMLITYFGVNMMGLGLHSYGKIE